VYNKYEPEKGVARWKKNESFVQDGSRVKKNSISGIL